MFSFNIDFICHQLIPQNIVFILTIHPNVVCSGVDSLLFPGMLSGLEENREPIFSHNDLKSRGLLFLLVIIDPANNVAANPHINRSFHSNLESLLNAFLHHRIARAHNPINDIIHATFFAHCFSVALILLLSIQSDINQRVILSKNHHFPGFIICSGFVCNCSFFQSVDQLVDQSVGSFVLFFAVVPVGIKLSRYLAICGFVSFMLLNAFSYPTAGRNGS